MKTTIATIIGTAALGLLKEKLGSGVKFVKQKIMYRVIGLPELGMSTYATSLDYLGININDIIEIMDLERSTSNINDLLTKENPSNRLILFPIENSPIIKSAGLFLDDIGISDEDENLGNLYDVFWSYVIEPYDENLVLDQETINHLREDIFEDICLAFTEAEKKVIGDDVAYDRGLLYGEEFRSRNVEEFIEANGEFFINNLKPISRSFVVIEKNEKKIRLNEYIKSKKSAKNKSKLRRR